MKRYLAGSLMVALAVVLVFPVLSEAKDFTGEGTLRAEGRGEIRAHGRGAVEYRLHGVGRLAVHHRLANRIEARGEGTRRVDGRTVIFRGYRGTVSVVGPKIAAHFAGGPVKFHAKGHGRVTLKGKGKYWVNGAGPAPWKPGGVTVVLGTPADAATDAADGTTTEVETIVVEDVVTYPTYELWLAAHPTAVEVVRLRVKRYYGWAKLHPDVVLAIRKGTPYSVWAKSHPAAAAALARQRLCIKKKLDLNKDGVVGPKEKRIGAKRRLDANKDGKVQPVEVKHAQHQHRVWKRHADRNKDHRVDKKERAMDALRRQQRRRP